MERKFVARFIVLTVLGGGALILAPDLADPAASALAVLSAWLLRGMGHPVVQRGIELDLGPALVGVGSECVGALLIWMVVSYHLALPGPWRARMRRAAWIVAVVEALNVVRIVACALLLSRGSPFFPLVHDYLWQAWMLGLTMALCLGSAPARSL